MIVLGLYFIILHLVHSQDICNTVNCGSGICILTQNPSLPYFCRCQSGSNTILPCPSENPCSRNPCGQGTCEAVPSLMHGYLCRCGGDVISLTSCNMTRNGCYSNPCINGLCIEGLSSFYCNCLPTWTGKLCNEKITSPCSISPCSPGKCFQLGDPIIPFVCLCPNGQFGLSCRNKYDLGFMSSTARMLTTTSMTTQSPSICNPFDDRACMNSGRCLSTTLGYRCLCSSGFTGVFCEMNINECASNPCQHGGICYDLQSSYTCHCPDGSFRSQCIPRIVSTSTARTLLCPCQNGGVCPMVGSQSCVCPNGFTGRYCERLLQTQLCNGIICRNGGVCNILAKNYTRCQCYFGYHGDFCERVAAAGSCNQIQCANSGTCYENSPGSSVVAYCLCKSGYTGKLCESEYFRCRSNGRFADPYNCEQGKYFECIHYQLASSGMLLSRSCPASLRFNYQADRCDYAQNVKCNYT